MVFEILFHFITYCFHAISQYITESMDSMIYVAGHNLREKRLRAEYLGACEILIYYCIQCMSVHFRICHAIGVFMQA